MRTRSVGHLRDVRRLVVAMSRARLGLYVFCRLSLFNSCFELQPVFQQLGKRPAKLQIYTNETYPTTRMLGESGGQARIVADMPEVRVLHPRGRTRPEKQTSTEQCDDTLYTNDLDYDAEFLSFAPI